MSSKRRLPTLLPGVIGLLYALMLILLKPQEPAVFFLWLIALLVMIIRLRFAMESRYFLIDGFVYAGLMIVFEDAIYLVVPSLVLWLAYGKWATIGLFLAAWLILTERRTEPLLYGVTGMVSGVLFYFWQTNMHKIRHENDGLREKVYRLEHERTMMLRDQDTLSRVSVLSERDRIAQALHDDLGHQLTGALMAMRALEVDRVDAAKHPSFQAVKTRLAGAVDSLKETVHQTKPAESIGVEQFKKVIGSFKAVPIDYTQCGDIFSLTITHWHVLVSILQEALTNIMKHAEATRIEIELQVSAHIVRLSVQNDHPCESKSHSGLGLSYMRRRLEALGGSLNIQRGYTFTLRCLIPIRLEGE